jgi:PDZ domain
MTRIQDQTGLAVPVLAEPFPAPEIVKVTFGKPASGKVGVHFRWGGGRGDRVRISKIAKNSPLQETRVNVGHLVLAINGVAAVSAIQAACLIRDSGPNVTIATLEESLVTAPFCMLITAPSSKHHPGVNFNSTRDRCLVQVSRVFSKGPFAGSGLHVGDIVLAVNGVPVSKPEDADRELREAQGQPYTILYVVNMAAYRISVLKELRASSIFHNVRLLGEEPSLNLCKEVVFAVGEEEYAKLEFDFETQHLVDRKAYLRLTSFAKERGGDFKFERPYRTKVLPFLVTYNDGMEARMRILEEAVCCAAWKHGAERCIEDASATSSAQGVEQRMARVPTVENNEHPTIWVPMAAVEIDVLTVETLQTCSDRRKNLCGRAYDRATC